VKSPQIAYITESSPADRHAWSGTAHYVYEALSKTGLKVHALGPLRPKFWRLPMAFVNQMSLKFFGKRFDYRHSTFYSKAFGRLFSKKLKALEYDLIVVCGSTECGAYIQSSKPIYYVLDRTIAGAINYHSILSDLWPFSLQQSIQTDMIAMKAAKGLFFSSSWAAEHASRYYQIGAEKIHVLPFGANMDVLPTRQEALDIKSNKVWKILLIANAWKNKGADIACNAARMLHQRNCAVQLTIVGSEPPEKITEEFIRILPFVDKNTVEGRKQLDALYTESHLFILPTRFDCTPIVFCEASSYGVPILSANTGGVAGHIAEGLNGFLIPYEDTGKAYADKIEEIITDPAGYEHLRISTRDYFEDKLNWNQWLKAFLKITLPEFTPPALKD
jgi:glycosyltransferase involved in cell wall biosynthesis